MVSKQPTTREIKAREMMEKGPVQKEETLQGLDMNVSSEHVFSRYHVVSQAVDPFTSFPQAFGLTRSGRRLAPGSWLVPVTSEQGRPRAHSASAAVICGLWVDLWSILSKLT